jgi:hypothetical protein
MTVRRERVDDTIREKLLIVPAEVVSFASASA